MKRYRLAAVFLAAAFLFSGCAQESDSAGGRNGGEESTMSVELRRVMIWRIQCPIRQNSKRMKMK